MLSKCHIRCTVIDPAKPLSKTIDLGFRQHFIGEETDYTFIELFPELKPNTVFRVVDAFLHRYILMELPAFESRQALIIGPYLTEDISHQQILEYGEKLKIPTNMISELERLFSSFPILNDEGFILALANSFAEYLWGGSDKFECADITRDNAAAFISKKYEIRLDREDNISSLASMETRYEHENNLLDAISQGNIHKAELLIANFSSLAFESRSPDRLRNMKNYLIVSNTLFRKAAEKGGVHPVYLNNVSGDFAKQIEAARTVAETQKLLLELLRAYCRLVRRHSVKSFSPPVQKAIIHIESDLTSDLSLNALAKINNVSPSYFSGLFKKETGQTLTEFVTEKRIAHAKHLLLNTSLQIQTVAQHCGILDLHYFCRVFKTKTGKTPGQYRAQISF